MELICIDEYNDIRFSMAVGDTTELVPYLTDEFKHSLLSDYPQKFKQAKEDRKDKSPELEIENKEDKLAKRTTKK